MSIFLKVKIKSLAEESRIIRLEERRAGLHHNRGLRQSLADHRRGVVRRESRNTLLAYAYLRGKSYRNCERTSHNEPNWDSIKRMIEKYGKLKQPLEEWKNEQESESLCKSAA